MNNCDFCGDNMCEECRPRFNNPKGKQVCSNGLLQAIIDELETTLKDSRKLVERKRGKCKFPNMTKGDCFLAGVEACRDILKDKLERAL